ncbi:hypothetical protein [Janthinobacterium sp. DSP2-3-3]|uniref:hypothetical protein n=1 Tax=Janthinobacterium sp. DSP2-3-3 TaxID=2804596 RepID=UPI003CEA35B0
MIRILYLCGAAAQAAGEGHVVGSAERASLQGNDSIYDIMHTLTIPAMPPPLKGKHAAI